MIKEARVNGLIDELEKIAVTPYLRALVPSAGKLMGRGAARFGGAGAAAGALGGGIHGGLSEKGTFLGGAAKGSLIGLGVGAGAGAGLGKFVHKGLTGTFKPQSVMGQTQRGAWQKIINKGVARRQAARSAAGMG